MTGESGVAWGNLRRAIQGADMDDRDFITVPTGRWLFTDDGTTAVPGWYGYRGFWQKAVASAPEGATRVEIGVFCGKSLIDLVGIVRASG